MSFARVRSLDALIDLKASLCTFAADAKEALSAVAMEIRRVENWLDDQRKYWTRIVKECEDEVFQAKQELARRKMMRISDRPPDTTEQEETLRRAQARLEHAEEKLERTQRWLRQFPENVIECEGPLNLLTGLMEGDLPKADALLEQKIAALEAYVQIASEPPKSP